MFGRAKTFHALDRAATVVGIIKNKNYNSNKAQNVTNRKQELKVPRHEQFHSHRAEQVNTANTTICYWFLNLARNIFEFRTSQHKVDEHWYSSEEVVFVVLSSGHTMVNSRALPLILGLSSSVIQVL
jgi:hypothetical protein